MIDIPWDLLRQEIACAIREGIIEGIIEGMREQAKVQEHAARGIMAATLYKQFRDEDGIIDMKDGVSRANKVADALWRDPATARVREETTDGR